MKTKFSHYEDSTKYICCLPCDGKVGKEVIDDQILWMWERQTVLVGAEDYEKYIAYDNTKKNTKRAKKIKEYPQNIFYHHQILAKLVNMSLYAARYPFSMKYTSGPAVLCDL